MLVARGRAGEGAWMLAASTVGPWGCDHGCTEQHTTDGPAVQCAAGSSPDENGRVAGTGVARRGPVAGTRPLNLTPAHISSPVRGVVECWDGGHLVTVKTGRVCERVGGGRRGLCGAFSVASRRRMLRLMGTLQNGAGALFVTLTYPAEWPGEWARWKRDLDVFLHRLKRKYPGAGVVWKLEPQARGAPHFHLLVFGVEFIPKEWLKAAWADVVDSGDELHRKHGAYVERVRDAKGVRSYTAKYLAKVPVAGLLEASGVDWSKVGRWWGVRWAECIPWADRVLLPLNDRQACRLFRVLRRYLERVAGVKLRPGCPSVSAFLDGGMFLSAIPRLL